MNQNVELTQDQLNDDLYEELWEVIINTGGKYELSKNQATFLQQAISEGNRGIVLFKTFSISIPYVSEFYRVKRFLKSEYSLPDRAKEDPYIPISNEKWEELKNNMYDKIKL